MKRFTLMPFLAIALVIGGCQTDVVPPINDVSYAGKLSDERVLVQTITLSGVTAEEIENAVDQATRNRGWEVSKPDDSVIVAELTHRSHESTLTFEAGDGWVKIYSLSYKIDKETQERIEREEPVGWIRNLHKDILELLDRLPES